MNLSVGQTTIWINLQFRLAWWMSFQNCSILLGIADFLIVSFFTVADNAKWFLTLLTECLTVPDWRWPLLTITPSWWPTREIARAILYLKKLTNVSRPRDVTACIAFLLNSTLCFYICSLRCIMMFNCSSTNLTSNKLNQGGPKSLYVRRYE
jgi:hypothetical protein